MGQQVATLAGVSALSTECGCTDSGFMSLCAPQDPNAERRTQFTSAGSAAYVPAEAHQTQERRLEDDIGMPPNLELPGAYEHSEVLDYQSFHYSGGTLDTNWKSREEKGDACITAPDFVAKVDIFPSAAFSQHASTQPSTPVPVAGQSAKDHVAGPSPQRSRESASIPVLPDFAGADPGAAAVAAAGTAVAAGGSGKPSRAALDLEFVIGDLEACEETVWGAAFADMAGHGGTLNPTDQSLHKFLALHTAIIPAELDTELIKVASQNDNFSINTAGFLSILRGHSISEGHALEQFLNLVADGDSMGAEDCRAGLLALMEEKLDVVIDDSRSERIFDSVMMDAGLQVPMDQWIVYCHRVARMLRLMRFANI